MYCKKCGTKLSINWVLAKKYCEPSIIHHDPFISSYPHYDRETGERLFIKEYKCPKAKWYKLLDWGHDTFAGGGAVVESDIITENLKKFMYGDPDNDHYDGKPLFNQK